MLRYVSGTIDYDIHYDSAIPIQLKGYNDADWTDYKANRRSTSGLNVFSLDSEAISWSNKKQLTVELLCIEAEYNGTVI